MILSVNLGFIDLCNCYIFIFQYTFLNCIELYRVHIKNKRTTELNLRAFSVTREEENSKEDEYKPE